MTIPAPYCPYKCDNTRTFRVPIVVARGAKSVFNLIYWGRDERGRWKLRILLFVVVELLNSLVDDEQLRSNLKMLHRSCPCQDFDHPARLACSSSLLDSGLL